MLWESFQLNYDVYDVVCHVGVASRCFDRVKLPTISTLKIVAFSTSETQFQIRQG